MIQELLSEQHLERGKYAYRWGIVVSWTRRVRADGSEWEAEFTGRKEGSRVGQAGDDRRDGGRSLALGQCRGSCEAADCEAWSV